METCATNRDVDICRRFAEGETQQDIADHYKLSKQRVQQILSRNGLSRYQGGNHVRSIERRERRKKIRAERLASLQEKKAA